MSLLAYVVDKIHGALPLQGVREMTASNRKTRGRGRESQRHRRQIRRLFLRPQERYTLRQAGNLIGAEEVRRSISEREIETDETGRFVAWQEVAFLALMLWGWCAIEDALGEQAGVLPPLVRTDVLRVRLPKFIVLAVRHAAAGKSLEMFLESELEQLTFPLSEAPEIERKAPGYIAAVHYPRSQDPKDDGERSAP